MMSEIVENDAGYDLSIHRSTDARVWAQFFMKCYADYKEPLDEAIMIGWFSNAMMAMYDEYHNKDASTITALQERVKELDNDVNLARVLLEKLIDGADEDCGVPDCFDCMFYRPVRAFLARTALGEKP